MSKEKRIRWHSVTGDQAAAIADVCSTPGVIRTLQTSSLPSPLHSMTGLVSAFVSAEMTEPPLRAVPSVVGEIVAVRNDGSTGKAYSYLLATTSGGGFCYAGPYKDMRSHHFTAGEVAGVAVLFRGTST